MLASSVIHRCDCRALETLKYVCMQSLPSEAEDLVDELPTDQEPAAFPEVVRTKTFNLMPMTLEEALVQVQ